MNEDGGYYSNDEEEQYEAGGVKMSYHGNTYQLRLLMYFLLRGLANCNPFALACDIKDADKFDDVVFRCKSGECNVYRLLQAKHRAGKQASTKITQSALLSESEKGDFSLKKYFRSFVNLSPHFSGEGKVIKDVILCTNAGFKVNEPFRSGKFGDIFELRKDGNGNEVVDEIFPTQLMCFKKNFEGREDILKLLRENVKGENVEEKAELFLDLLSFAFNQPNNDSLKEKMMEELKIRYMVGDPEMVFALFQQRMYDWMTNIKGTYFTAQKAKKLMEELRIKFGSFRFDFEEPIENFKGRRKELDEIWQAKNNGKNTVILSGLGGIGKTELARRFVQKNSGYFRRVIWIKGDSPESLLSSFCRLRERLNISSVGADGKEKCMDSILEEVYQFFDGDDSIFVFDNVEKMDQNLKDDDYVKTFLPTSLKKPFLLITSKMAFWDDAFVLPVGEILEEDAKDLIKTSLLPIVTNDIHVEKLAQTLQNFPLALQQAFAYIKHQDKVFKFGIEDFLELYRKKAKKILDFKISSFRKNDYAKSTFSTLSKSLKMIEKEKDDCIAYSMLKLISNFSPSGINISDIRKYFSYVGDYEFRESLRLLKKYSIISIADNIMSIHRLVQQVVRITLKNEGEDEIIK